MDEPGQGERALLEEAAAWRLIGLTFARPRGDWEETIRLILGERSVDAKVAMLAARAIGEATEAGFLSAFGPGGAVSPREVSYRPDVDPGRVLAELKARHDSFSFRPQTEEPPDHISVEVGFVGFMRLKEACARMMGQAAYAVVIRAAADQFVRDHLVYLAAGLRQRPVHGYLRDAVDILVERLEPMSQEAAMSARRSSGAGA